MDLSLKARSFALTLLLVFITASQAAVAPPRRVWKPVGAPGISPNNALFVTFTIQPNSNTPYVAFSDFSSSKRAKVMRYSSSTGTWEYVGNSSGITKGYADSLQLASDKSGAVYLGCRDGVNDNKITVFKLKSGGVWSPLGKAGFTGLAGTPLSMTLSTSGVPYIAYSDNTRGGKATVMRFNSRSNKWELVGSAGFTPSSVNDVGLKLALDKNNVPYIITANKNAADRIIVMKYDGRWKFVDSPGGFSAIFSIAGDITFSKDNTPYIAYIDGVNGFNAPKVLTVMRYVNKVFATVGSAAFVNDVSTVALRFSKNDVLYTAFNDGSYGKKAGVKRFENDKWITVGQSSVSVGPASFMNLAFSPNNVPYIAYMDNGLKTQKVTVSRYM